MRSTTTPVHNFDDCQAREQIRTYTRVFIPVVFTVTLPPRDGSQSYVLNDLLYCQSFYTRLVSFARFDPFTIVFIQFIRPSALHAMLEPVRHRLIYAFWPGSAFSDRWCISTLIRSFYTWGQDDNPSRPGIRRALMEFWAQSWWDAVTYPAWYVLQYHGGGEEGEYFVVYQFISGFLSHWHAF